MAERKSINNQKIIKPIMSEKSIKLADGMNVYSLLVQNSTTKIDLKNIIEKKYNVKVIDIKTINNIGKKVKFGKKRIPGLRKGYKKALIKLKKGDKLPFFEVK